MRGFGLIPLFLIASSTIADESVVRDGVYASASLSYAGHTGFVDIAQEDEDDFWSIVGLTSRRNMELSSGPGYDLRLGGWVSSHDAIYVIFSQTFFGHHEYNVDKRLTSYGLGFNHYFTPDKPSFFASTALQRGTINFSDTAEQDGDNLIDEKSGLSFSLGVGREVGNSWQFGVSYSAFYTNVDIFEFFLDPARFYSLYTYGINAEYKFDSRLF